MRKKILALGCAALLLISVLTGCSSTKENKKSMKFTVMLSQDHMYDSVGRTLEAKFPDVEFEFTTTHTGADSMLMQAHHGDLPDILVGSPNGMRYDNDDLNAYLYNFDGTDIPGLFYKVYLDNFKASNGEVYWLPGCAALEGIVANKTLFDRYQIELPTDYASFAEACAKFEENGIRGYATDWKYDYTDTYAIQTWNAEKLQSADGLKWRAAMISGSDFTMDDGLGTAVFKHLQEVLLDTDVTPEDAKRGYTKTYQDFCSGNLAMMRNNSKLEELKQESGIQELVLLPFFGEKENWYFSSPAYSVALNASLKGDEREETALEIVRTLFTQEVIEGIAQHNGGTITYVKNAHLTLESDIANVQPYVDNNHIYMLMGIGNIYSASQDAVQSMIEQNASAEEALQIFNEELARKEDRQPVLTTFEKTYSWLPTKSGSEAFSAVANTLRKINGVDLLLMTADTFTTSVYAGDYTEAQLTNLLMSGGTYCFSCRQATGASIRELVRRLVEGTGQTDDPVSWGTLPVSSGFEMQISKDANGKFHLDGITVNGKPLKDDQTYSFGHADLHASENLLGAYGMEDVSALIVGEDDWTDGMDDQKDLYKRPNIKIVDQWLNYFKNGGTLETPTAYLK